MHDADRSILDLSLLIKSQETEAERVIVAACYMPWSSGWLKNVDPEWALGVSH